MKKALPYILVVLAAAGLYGMGRHAANLSAELATWKQAAQDALKAREGYQRAVDSLRGLERALEARNVALQGDLKRLGSTADRLAQRVDSLEASGGSVDSLLPAYRRALLGSQAAYVVCRGVLAVSDSGWTTCRERASLAEQRAERLDSLLRQGVKVRSCRILGLAPCPSRGVSLMAGLVGGFLLAKK